MRNVASVSQVSEAIRTALRAVQGLRVVEYIPDSLNPPMATVGADTVTYHGAFGAGNPVYQFTVSGGNITNINVNDVIYLSVEFAIEVYA